MHMMLVLWLVKPRRYVYYVVDDILYYEETNLRDHRCELVPSHLRQKSLDEHHDLPFVGHFTAKKMV